MATFTVRLAPAPLEQALEMGQRLEEHIVLDPTAVSTFEVDEENGLWTVEAHFAGMPNAGAIAEAVGEHAFEIDRLEETDDWVGRSLAGLDPVCAGRFFVHGAHHRGGRPPGACAIEIEAAQAFGTGHHGTTRGCLEAFSDLIRQRRPVRVVDVGCGSGVLAMAAALAGARVIVASDIDPVAIRETRRNLVGNGLGGRVRTCVAGGVGHRLIRELAPYDVVFANILARPLKAMAGDLARVCARGGSVIVSGLLANQENGVLAAMCAHGLVLRRRRRLGSWSTLTVAKA